MNVQRRKGCEGHYVWNGKRQLCNKLLVLPDGARTSDNVFAYEKPWHISSKHKNKPGIAVYISRAPETYGKGKPQYKQCERGLYKRPQRSQHRSLVFLFKLVYRKHYYLLSLTFMLVKNCFQSEKIKFTLTNLSQLLCASADPPFAKWNYRRRRTYTYL
mgnify:CR=1 FL=1